MALCVFSCPLRPCWVVFGFGLVWGWCDAEYGFLFDLEIHFQPLKVCNPPSLHRLSQPFYCIGAAGSARERIFATTNILKVAKMKKILASFGMRGVFAETPYFSPEQDVKQDKIDSVFGLGRIRDDGTKQFFRNDEISDGNSGMLRSAFSKMRSWDSFELFMVFSNLSNVSQRKWFQDPWVFIIRFLRLLSNVSKTISPLQCPQHTFSTHLERRKNTQLWVWKRKFTMEPKDLVTLVRQVSWSPQISSHLNGLGVLCTIFWSTANFNLGSWVLSKCYYFGMQGTMTHLVHWLPFGSSCMTL